MRIAYLMHGLGYGGAGTSLYLLIKSLKKYDHIKHLYASHITFSDALNDYMKYCDSFNTIPIKRIYNDLAGGKTSLKNFHEIISEKNPQIIKALINQKIDIIHINSSVFPHLLSQIKEETNCKIVTHVREIIPSYDNGEVQQYMINQIKSHSDAIICISDNEAIPFIKEHKNCHILANPFDFSVTKKINSLLRKEYKIPKRTIIVGMAGKFSYSKGQLEFLKIIKHIKNNYYIKKDVLFIIMGFYKFNPIWKVFVKKILGKQDYGAQLKRYITQNKLGNDVLLLPYKYNFFNYLIDIDIMVRPALSADPWGRDIIEAMALGKPVIATGNSEFFIKNNENGFLVPPSDPLTMSEKIITLINDAELRRKMGEKSKTIIRQKCDISHYGINVNDIYNSLKIIR